MMRVGFAEVTAFGKVLDAETREAIPGATVFLYSGDKIVGSAVATSTGEFSITSSTGIADTLLISSVGYVTQSFLLATRTTTYLLKRSIKELDPVVVYSSKKFSWWWLALAGLVFIKKKKRNAGSTRK